MKLYRHFLMLLLLASTALNAATQAAEQSPAREAILVQLAAPLTTFIEAPDRIQGDVNSIQAMVIIPQDAPSDLGVGAYVKDDDGNWFQLPTQTALKPGLHHLHFQLDNQHPWQSEPHFEAWEPYQQALAVNYGLFFWSAQENNCQIQVQHVRAVWQPALATAIAPHHITQVSLAAIHPELDHCSVRSGERWSLQCHVDPMPSNPYDSDLFELQLHISGPDGEYQIPGFYQKPIQIIDGGDRDRCIPNGAAHFSARFRPRVPGNYTLSLVAIWNKDSDAEQRHELPLLPLQVSGEHWDDFIRVDQDDKRFFCVGPNKQFHWPIGLNIRSVTDPRGTQATHSQVTPERIVQAYKAYFDRLALAGANNVEIWMASWNVGLEWLDEWPGFHGIGAYHEGNAQRLDEILDYAYSKGLRIILVINNHGQASFKTDREWSTSPFNSLNGGPLNEAKEFFTDPAALHAQQERRRYIVGRYADHPAILCWKLFSEMNLTDMARNGADGPGQMRLWHQHAFDAWQALDIYDHPCTSHWSGDYRTPYRDLVALPNMDFTAIDAYHGRRNGRGHLLANLMHESTLHQELGLSQFNKPVVVTEYGAGSGAGPEPQLIAEHMSGPWAALMSGHASSPHLWWFEWTDQGERWHPYRAVSNYVKGEDFRSSAARCVYLQVTQAEQHNFWCRAWFKPGIIYGYLLDWDWGFDGTTQVLHQQISIPIGNQIQSGVFELEWWDANMGTVLLTQIIEHQTGPLIINCPDFRRHLAFKLRRKSTLDTNQPSPE